MKRFFTKTGIWLLAGAAVIAVVLCIISALGSGTSLLHNALGVIASPFRAAGCAVRSSCRSWAFSCRSASFSACSSSMLAKWSPMPPTHSTTAEPAAEENQRLRELLDLRAQRSDLVFEAARITQRDVSNWSSTLVLNRGSRHGVAENDCAVDCYGNLVGVVTEVGLNWCRLTTILDTGSQLGAMVFRTEETAIAAGDLSLMTEGRLKLSYLPDSSTLIKGDLVVTSGLGGYYPSGLPIGSVEEVRTDDGGLARYAVLTPRCDPDALTDLYIITDFDVVE